MSIKQASSTVLAIMLVVSIIVNVNPFSAFIFPNVLASPPPGYNYSPSFNATGSNFSDIPHHPTLSLEKFSVAAWFKTSKNYTDEGLIVNKGGFGSELAGQNLNYGIWMDKDEKIRAGFETASGTDYFLQSTSTYSDNNWHYAVVTYDGSNVRLYIDGLQVAGRTFAITPPDTGGTQPLRIGANSRGNDNYFTGAIDEVRVWSSAFTATNVANQYYSGLSSMKGYNIPIIGGVKPTTVTHGSAVNTVCDSGCTHKTVRSAIDGLPSSGGKVILKASKAFTALSTIFLSSNMVIEFEHGATFTYSGTGPVFSGNKINNVMFINPVISRSSIGDAIYFSNADNIIVKGGIITGVKGGPDYDKSNGFECRSCKNVLVEGGTYSSWSRPIATTTLTATRDGTSQNIWIEKNTIRDGSVECVRTAHGMDIHVNSNFVRDCGNNGIDVGYNIGVEAKYNTLTNTGYGSVDNAVGIHTDHADTVIILGNTIEKSGTNGISLCSSDNNFVISNTIRDSGQVVSILFYPGDGHGIEVIKCASTDNPENTIIDGNTITGSHDGYGVYIGNGATNTKLSNNILLSNEKGPYLNNGILTTISGN